MNTAKDNGARPARLHLVACAALVAGVVATLGGLVPLRSWDLWWHVAMGSMIDHFGAVPIANHLLYSHPVEAPAFDLPWLSQWGVALVHRLGEVEAVLTARNLLAALAFGMASYAAGRRARSGLAGAILGGVGASLAGHFTDAGPALVAAPLFGICLVTCAEARDHASPRAPLVAGLVLAACAGLWANLDHAFMLPALLAALMGLDAMLEGRGAGREGGEGAEDRASTSSGVPWFAVAAVCAAAPLLNPRGALLFEHTVTALSLYPTHPDASAWAPLLPWWSLEGAGVWGLLAVCVAARWRGPREGRVLDLGALVALGLLAVTHQRATLWLGLALPFAMASALAGLIPADRASGAKLARVAVILAALTLPWVAQPMMVTHAPLALSLSPFDVRRVSPHAGVIGADVPITSVELIAQQLDPPRIYAPAHLSGLLLWRLNDPARPKQLVFTDPRHELTTPKLLEIRELLESTDIWRGIFQQYDVRAALLDTRTQSGLVEALYDSPVWHELHSEGSYRAFLRVAPSAP